MKIFPLSKDPEREAECARYQKPTASRTYIKHVLNDFGRPVYFDELCQSFDISDDSELCEKLLFRLKAMLRDGELVEDRKGRFGLPEHMNLRRGRVVGHPDGFGFVVLEGGGEDWYLPPKEMRRLLPDDKVLVHVRDVRRNGRIEASVVRILEEGKKRIVGQLKKEGPVTYVVPQDRAISFDIQIDSARSVKAKPGELVVVELIERPSRHRPALGLIVERLGQPMAPGMEIAVALRSFDLPFEWPEDVLAQTEAIPDSVTQQDIGQRRDLRDLPLVTIDGEDARDFDDAVFCKRRRGGFTLWVAIADVSHYVQPDTPLDQHALERGNSVYFPGEVIPMLPEKLSNGLCSLNPKVDRLAMVCEMQITHAGRIKGYQFYPAVIRSHARLTYTQVWNYLSGSQNAETALGNAAHLAEHLDALHALYGKLAKQRAQRGAIEFETEESQFIFNDQRKIERIVPTSRNDAHRLIEECMIAANVCAAEFIAEHFPKGGMFRNHAGPAETRLAAFRDFLGLLGLQLGGGDEPSPADYRQLLEATADRKDAEQIQMMALRSLSQAVYGVDNLGHFGLALASYTHFTSPIRRYPDLIVHRLIKAILVKQGQIIDGSRAYERERLIEFADHCSVTERRADQATRDVADWLKCEFMLDKVGETFAGRIVGVASFGIFVRLTEQFIEGLVHISNLPADYYIFDAAAQRLTGERTRQTFTLGDHVTVRVTNVDLEQRHIDFELTGHQRSKKQRNSKSKKASTKTKSKSQITKGKSKPKKTKSVKRARSRRKK